MIRMPVVAGSFYPGAKAALEKDLSKLVPASKTTQKCLGIVSPHAGYIYSGACAGKVFSRIEVPDTVVILAPNHTGLGVPFSVWDSGKWRTPLGDAEVDSKLCSLILQEAPMAEPDEDAHAGEHSAEVQVPFIQYRNPSARIAPVVIGSHSLSALKQFGSGLARAIQAYGGRTLVVASSDMSHYEPDKEARRKDQLAIDKMLEFDEEGLFATVARQGITMCGVAPTVAMLACARELGGTKAELVDYRTSGDASGDYTSVVGYAGLIVS